MKRRFFLSSGSAAVAAVLSACGGGGGGGAATDAAAGVNTSPPPGTGGTTAGTVAAAAPATTTTTQAPATQQPQQQPAQQPQQQPQQQEPAGPRPAIAYPFGARLDRYVAGIMPTVASAASMDATIKRCYEAWKNENLRDTPSVPGGKAVKFDNRYLTCSEGMGYGMLIMVLMAGHDPRAREYFDGLLKTVRARPAYSIPGEPGRWLMDWKLEIDGRSSDSAGGGWNAMDGDQDIAMALLMADRQWGSDTGDWNYKQEGINTINAMKSWNMKPDGTTKGLATAHISRTSDYMISHFRAYAKATGDRYWDTTVIDRCYQLIDRMQNVYSPGVGLMPDFIVKTDTANPEPSPGGMGDFVMTEMYYYANAQRNPWRWGTDYVTSGDVRWKNVLNKMMTFFKRDTGGDPARTATGYAMNGGLPSPLMRPIDAGWTPKGMIGPQLCGAMCDPAHQDYLNALWNFNANNFSTLYYDAELQLIPMIVAAGNWWQP